MQKYRLLLSGLVAFVLIGPSIFAQQRYTGISSDTLRVLVMNAGKEAVPVTISQFKLANESGPGLKVAVDPAVVVRTKTEPIKWEYKFVHVVPGHDEDEARYLDEEGDKGWETVGVVFSAANSATMLMKRPK